MFSTLWNFFRDANVIMVKHYYTITMIQSRDAQFDSMSRSQLLKLRDSCFSLANDITAHLTALDMQDEFDSIKREKQERADNEMAEWFADEREKEDTCPKCGAHIRDGCYCSLEK